MTSKEQATRERYSQAARSRAAENTAPAAVPAAPKPAVTRMTLDLDAEQRRTLARWTAQLGLELDRPRLASTEVLRAMISMLEEPAEDAEPEGERYLMGQRARSIIRTMVAERLGAVVD